MHRTRLAVAALAGAAAALSAAPARSQDPLPAGAPGNPVVTWNRELLAILRTPGAQPATVHPTRTMAPLHAATADAVSAIARGARRCLVADRAPRRASRAAAVDAAAHDGFAAVSPSMPAGVDRLEARELA